MAKSSHLPTLVVVYFAFLTKRKRAFVDADCYFIKWFRLNYNFFK